MDLDFYKQLFSSQSGGLQLTQPLSGISRFTEAQNVLMEMLFKVEDVRRSLFSMKGGKASGLDGITAKVFQFYWDSVGLDLFQMVLDCVNEGKFLRKFNFTLITLVPKVPKPINKGQFCPIVLCNTVAKLIGKVLARHLKQFLHQLSQIQKVHFYLID
ncbi:hypothetical protein LIER_21193 [Lithospermum erythrorhizon]|uniref:Reverse transcriptase n=1 Tax=Lithospermum erythrorhizon TaxID=34254 RepID=A0AAV3QPF5_LITER